MLGQIVLEIHVLRFKLIYVVKQKFCCKFKLLKPRLFKILFVIKDLVLLLLCVLVSIVSLFRLLSVLNYFSNLGAELQTQALTLEVHKKTLIFFSFFFVLVRKQMSWFL